LLASGSAKRPHKASRFFCLCCQQPSQRSVFPLFERGPTRVGSLPAMSPLAAYVVETFVTLIAVVALAVLVLYGARRLGIGRPLGPMQLVGRLPLDARRAVILVRVADQVLILGVSEAGIQKLGDLAPEALRNFPSAAEPRFSDVLARLKLQRDKSKPSSDPTRHDATTQPTDGSADE
jgi:flagellar biogenesis protein FliO